MITMLAGLFINRGMSPKNARALAWVGLIIAGLLLLWGMKAAYDAAVVDDYRTEVNLDASRKDHKADIKAAERAAADARRLDFEIDQLEKAVTNAPQDPNVADDTERRLAYHRCLRLQQTARANGSEPPRCV